MLIPLENDLSWIWRWLANFTWKARCLLSGFWSGGNRSFYICVNYIWEGIPLLFVTVFVRKESFLFEYILICKSIETEFMIEYVLRFGAFLDTSTAGIHVNNVPSMASLIWSYWRVTPPSATKEMNIWESKINCSAHPCPPLIQGIQFTINKTPNTISGLKTHCSHTEKKI